MAAAQEDTAKVRWRKLDQLTPNPLNPRPAIKDDELVGLVCSIREQGVLQPLLVTPPGRIVAGHRRHRAAKLAGLDRVPVYERQMTEREQLEAMLTENIQREELTPLQEARAFKALINQGANRNDIARRLGLPSMHVSDRLLLLEMDPAVAGMFDRLELPVVAIRPISRAASQGHQIEVAGLLARRQLRVKDIPDHLEAMASGTRVPTTRAGVKRAVKKTVQECNRPTPREEALEALSGHPKRLMTFRALVDVLEATCCACGLAASRDACTQCPLPKFVMAAVKESEHVRRTGPS